MSRYIFLKSSPRCPIIGREKAAIVFAETSTGPGMKSLSCGSTKKTSNAQPAYARATAREAPNVQSRMQQKVSMLRVGFDEAYVAAAFDARDFYFRKIIGFGGEAHIFFDIVFGNLVSPHACAVEFPVVHDHG